MNRRKEEKSAVFAANIGVSLGLLVLSGAVVVTAQQLPRTLPGIAMGPGVLPLWAGLLMSLLAVSLLIQNIFFRSPSLKRRVFEPKELAAVGKMFFAISAYAAGIEYLGFGMATCIIVVYLSRYLGQYAWWRCLLFGLIMAGVSVGVFRYFLDLPLPTGWFGL
nr:tripartite tricarboxylate transporter TctB family protein [Heliobacterium chlorum]